jgi:mannose-6-phosphate isomerase
LTPKLKDVPTLVNMLTYKTCRPETTFGEMIDECTTRYTPPVPDFCVEQIVIPANTRYEIANVNSPSVLLVIEGDGKLQQDRVVSLAVSFGMSTFCSAGTAVTAIAGDYGMTLTRACNNVFLG